MTQKWDVVIVGGGLAGYVAANLLSRTNLSILLLEKGKSVGGRSRTNKMHNQYLNLGPHALNHKGIAKSILEELGITLNGKSPKLGGILIENNIEYAAPFSPLDLFTTNLLNWKERIEWISVLLKMMKINPEKLADQTFQQWAKDVTQSKKVESILYTLGRLATYCHAPELVSAKAVVSNLQIAMGGVLYLDGGWQMIVDQLHNKAIVSGVKVQSQTLVKKIKPIEQDEFKLILSTNEEILGKYVICTTGPHELNEMLIEEGNHEQNSEYDQITPVKGATLDIALTQLPNPKLLFAMGFSDPLYYSVHLHYARLSDDTTSVVLHVFKYHHPDEHIDGASVKTELEQFLDKLQPGWKQYVITKRFLPNITVNQRLPQIGDERWLNRLKTKIPGLYLAGDWASPNSILADGAVSSGKDAAEDLILYEKRKNSAN
ncbi:phytoene dehydrogenase-like protein [Metabacillus crassostreae]|uniref:phytoene desaturase family protein n=1 Tax=Metabacillus crassostreae TaxID=929098 RepID=UPI0019562DE0|nr:FAD-dependent oxidoreductase [Metabacillus crassostreae]MBM7602837.1 phytoene dehydrogenase-like protein [Metabacillus crassostreae]